MLISHIVANILFWLFVVLVIFRIKQCIKTMKHSKFIIATGVMGVVVYIFYLVVLMSNSNRLELDYQSFTLVMLAWAFENSSYCIINKSKG